MFFSIVNRGYVFIDFSERRRKVGVRGKEETLTGCLPHAASAPTAVSYTHLTLPTKTHQCRSRWSPYH